MKKKVPQKTVSTKITVPMHNAMTKLLEQNAHVCPSDYLRDLIRRDLESKGFDFFEDIKKKE